ncbi:hypothetical protein EF903_17895 [Streptomyces sp. WAC05292]|nr:hypothetical protein EF903_17895 [Streptomyces sp. WAC05292]
MVKINGFDDDSLVAGEELVSRRGFWAAYLMWMCYPASWCVPEPPPTPEWFGADSADAYAVHDALTDEDNRPVFRIPFGGGHTAVVVNGSEDRGTHYLITHPDWERHGHLATINGPQAGPGLSWRELLHIAETPDRESPGIHDRYARLLLLLPAMSDEETLFERIYAMAPTPAIDAIAEALVRVGVMADKTVRMAEILVDHPLWDPTSWSLSDEQPFGGILYSNDPRSPRHDLRLAQGTTYEQHEQLARALGTWPV